MQPTTLKQRVCDEVDRLADALLDVSHQIHARPELSYEEHFAHGLLTEVIEGQGVAVERGAYGCDTGFAASVGDAGPRIAVLCEYDALPDIGHACGHNVIAAAGLGAGLAAAAVARQAGGTVVLLGTPAEEGGGGKVLMARRGAFDQVDAAMMVHPADADLARMDAIAIQAFEARFLGRAAHAAAAPHQGRNALDAAVLAYMNVAALRQHILPTERIHGTFSNGGGFPNIVPREAVANWFVRSPTIASLQPLKERVLACMEAGALACGCSFEPTWDDFPYADVQDNGPLVAAYCANSAALGRVVQDPQAIGKRVVGSTDMGNVSYLVPSIHPMVQVSPDGVPIHTPEFAGFAGAEEGDRAVIDGAKAMAMTVVDLWLDASLRRDMTAAFATIGPDPTVL